MCTTMNELEKVVADYRSLKAMKEELDAQLKDAEREMLIVFVALFPWVICKVTGDPEYYGMYLMAAPIVAGLIWDLIKGNWR